MGIAIAGLSGLFLVLILLAIELVRNGKTRAQ